MTEIKPIQTREIYLFRHGYSQANLFRKQKILLPKVFSFLRTHLGFRITLKLIQGVDLLRGFRTRSKVSDSDTPLESIGHLQAKLTGEILAAKQIYPDLLLCSDYLRTRETTSGILEGIQNKAHLDLTDRVLYSKLIVERHGGDDYGYPISYYPVLFPKVNKMYKKTSRYDFRPPGSESIRDIREKRIPALLEIINRLSFNTLFIVGHGITNSTIVSLLTGADIEKVQLGSPNLSVYKFIYSNGNWVLDTDFRNGETIDPSIPNTE